MTRLIDADELKEFLNWTSCKAPYSKEQVLMWIDMARAVDAVPVVRCRDCKYYREDGDCWHEWDNDGQIYYQSVINEPNPNDYCSKADRKEE